MPYFLIVMLAASPAPVDDPIRGAFGIELGSNATDLEQRGFMRTGGDAPGNAHVYLKIEKDELLSIKKVRATPVTGKIVGVEGMRFYKSASLLECHKDSNLIRTEIERKYPAIKIVPAISSYTSDVTSSVYASRIGRFGNPESRQISVSCATQTTGGSALIVTYSGNRDEIRLSISEQDMDKKARSAGALKDRGLNPDDL